MEKKYQIFISSTYVDLKEERRKVKDTILSMFQFPIGMEMFSADDEEQWKIIKETTLVLALQKKNMIMLLVEKYQFLLF